MIQITDEQAGFEDGNVVSVDGLRDQKHPEIHYWGKATKQPDGTWQCLANVGGVLALVEVSLSRGRAGY